MAERHMISKRIVDTDLFLDMPATSRLLYYDLLIRADDDGFVAAPKRIARMTGCGEDDLKLLVLKQFIIPFESGVCVIRDWRAHNWIRKDRYCKTVYSDEFAQLTIDDKGAYHLIEEGIGQPVLPLNDTPVSTNCHTNCHTSEQPDDDQLSTNCHTSCHTDDSHRLGKDRLGKDNIESTVAKAPRSRFTRPSLDEVKAYCAERKNQVDPEKFIDYYDANGWKVGRSSMKDWKAAVRNWERQDFRQKDIPTGASGGLTDDDFARMQAYIRGER